MPAKNQTTTSANSVIKQQQITQINGKTVQSTSTTASANAQPPKDDDNENNTDDENENDNNSTEFDENEKRKISNNIPPVDIWTETQQATQATIRHNLPNYSCTFSIVNKTKTRVLPKSNEIRTKLINLLKEREIEFNTYTPADEKMQNVLLKGTEIDDEEVIIETLKMHGIIPHKIQRFQTGYMRKNKIKSNIWQIVPKPKTDTKIIFNIKYVAEWSVKWQMMRKPTVIQCKRRQRLNHSASNCTLPYRCVKCTQNHKTG